MNNGWAESADAWMASQGDHGDFGRRYVLDPVMLPRAVAGSPTHALDVGCGEGRFCRRLAASDFAVTGIDPTPALHHRPMRRYMHALLGAGLTLTWFDEPEPIGAAPAARAAAYRRLPWFVVMEWRKAPG